MNASGIRAMVYLKARGFTEKEKYEGRFLEIRYKENQRSIPVYIYNETLQSVQSVQRWDPGAGLILSLTSRSAC